VQPAWLEAWQRSTRGLDRADSRPEDEAGPEERLAVWRAIRASGDLPQDATFFLVAGEIWGLAEHQLAERMAEVERRVDAIWSESGIEAWRRPSDLDSPDEQDFPERCPEAWDRMFFELLREHGEEEAAQLYRADRERFDERMKAGREFFVPPPPPEAAEAPQAPPWAKAFAKSLASARVVVGVATTRVPFGLVWLRAGRHWVVRVALPRAEWISGPRDGTVQTVVARFDLARLARFLDEVREFSWEADELPAVELRGTWRGHRVVLRLLDRPFEGAEPVRVNDTGRGLSG